MKFIDEYRRSELAQKLTAQIKHQSRTPVRLMEFCGSHTVSIYKHGIRQLLPKTIDMISGPGCPVCVTANADLDKALALAELPGVILATFGDMMKVPGSRSTLQEAKAGGADVRTVYSTMDALDLAASNPDKSIIFMGVGFETTSPTVAVSILQAEEKKLKNYYVLSLHKLCPPVIQAILKAGQVKLNGLLCPGHVSTITGSQAWEFIARDYGIPCVVSGFEPVDILQSIAMLVNQVESRESKVEIAYRRGVTVEGNPHGLKVIYRVFEPCAATWRGIGEIPDSGLKIRNEYRRFDAELNFDIKTAPASEPQGCICGEILRGNKTPVDCRLFGRICTPESPVGPCMVSTEGTCSACYLYGENIER